ncbi:GNAT family N-acetyltransferase [Glutamicibacter nicotianae]|uniref:N-acetyltransferase n=1 Tax=Glutamicibacter nicotianae TaxID=37929 RepID=A0ABQ0RM27_GLUNI|nr:GNAT family N-acetyltransferase [Glutamicibacter nicotianae]GEC12536.1 N-acetyltransferase [Glutamicibacter nicotianae]
MQLREVRPSDLDAFFAHQQEPEANLMAAYQARNPADRAVFDHHWNSILNDPNVLVRTIEHEGDVVGSILVFDGEVPEINFWTSTKYWGKGLTTSAVEAFLAEYTKRPLTAHVVQDNLGSIKVLERRGFKTIGTEQIFSNARAEVVTENVMQLD